MNLNDINNSPKCAGIYCIKNSLNGKVYVGQAIKLQKRLKSHWHNYTNPRYSNISLYCAINKYGIDNFELSILKTFSDALSCETKRQLDYWEKFYIQEYDSYNNGYNSTLGSDKGVLGLRQTEETKEIIRAATLKTAELKREQLSTDPVNWIKARNVETGEVHVFTSRKSASESLLLPEYTISNCLLKRIHIGNKKWQVCNYTDEFEQIDDIEECLRTQFKELSNKEEICNYIKANPRCTYGEIKQNYDLSKKTFFNYKNELGIKFDKRADTKITKEDFIEYYNQGHSKEEFLFHFHIAERLYYKYKKEYLDGC